jgi:NAD(P)-dependent dehydrogenase (short-subunit alcohol dehydrogenase family)
LVQPHQAHLSSTSIINGHLIKSQSMAKSIFITGCSAGGIGSALAREFHFRGHHVMASGRTASEIDPALSPLGITTLVLDVTSSESVDSAARRVKSETGGALDVLVNSAGVMHVMPFADEPVTEVRRLFDVNVFAIWAVTQAFLPLLLEAQGVVVNIGSINAGLCPPLFGAYNASKAAVEALSRTMRRELAPLGVRVVTVKTGSVRSALFDHAEGITIPDKSIYAPLREWVARRGYLRGARFVELDDYARDVVGDLIRDDVKPVIWRGGLAFLAWVMSWFGWETMMVSLTVFVVRVVLIVYRIGSLSKDMGLISYSTQRRSHLEPQQRGSASMSEASRIHREHHRSTAAYRSRSRHLSTYL